MAGLRFEAGNAQVHLGSKGALNITWGRIKDWRAPRRRRDNVSMHTTSNCSRLKHLNYVYTAAFMIFTRILWRSLGIQSLFWQVVHKVTSIHSDFPYLLSFRVTIHRGGKLLQLLMKEWYKVTFLQLLMKTDWGHDGRRPLISQGER